MIQIRPIRDHISFRFALERMAHLVTKMGEEIATDEEVIECGTLRTMIDIWTEAGEACGALVCYNSDGATLSLATVTHWRGPQIEEV